MIKNEQTGTEFAPLTEAELNALTTVRGIVTDSTEVNQPGACPHCGCDLQNGAYEHDPSENYKCEERRFCCMGCGGEWGPLLRRRTGVSHIGKSGKREQVSVKQWLRANPHATYAQALEYVKSTGRSEITLKIQARNIGYKFLEV